MSKARKRKAERGCSVESWLSLSGWRERSRKEIGKPATKDETAGALASDFRVPRLEPSVEAWPGFPYPPLWGGTDRAVDFED